jgi:hypothetical protein
VSPGVLERLEQKSVKEAEANMSGAFHCKTPDCAGWTVIGRWAGADTQRWILQRLHYKADHHITVLS